MPKYTLGLIVLAFVAGAAMGAIIFSRAPVDASKAPVMEQQEEDVVSEQLPEKQAKKEDDDKDEGPEELEGNYADPATCEALYNAQTYAKDEDFMFMLPGKNSWVFRTRQDLQMAFDVPEDDHLALYQKFVGAMKAKGTELVIAYIPTRGMIATDMLPENADQTEDYDAASARENYNALITKMREAGVNFVGTPNPEIGAAYFNHADQHWSTQGARSMAQAVADFVKDQPYADQLQTQVFKTTVGEEVSYDGRFGEFIKEKCGFRPQPEKDVLVKTERVGSEDTQEALLGDETPPQVVLVGTSNSIRDEFNSNFDGYLKEALSTDVYNAAISGGGMDDALLSYLASERFTKTTPKLLIWELPGYYDMGGAGMEFALRQAIGGVMGFCEKPLATFAPTIVEGKKIMIFEDLEAQNIGAQQAYIAIKFNEPVTKDFSISIKTSDKKNQKFKFKKRREGHGDTFYYLPKGNDVMLSSVAVNVSKAIAGLSMEARLCAVSP